MPDQMNERLGQSNPEILKPESYGGVYGRLLVASYSPPENLPNYLNPEWQIGLLPPIDASAPRNYSQITEKLSKTEREAAWGEMRSPDEYANAYNEWAGKFTNAIKTTNDEGMKTVVQLISGKDVSEYTDQDTRRLYDALCSGQSDTTTFVNVIVKNLNPIDTSKKIDPQDLNALMPSIKRVASWFFGKQTAEVVSKKVELEAALTNDAPGTIHTLELDTGPSRMNNLNPGEIAILTPLYKSFEQPQVSTPEPSVTPPPIDQDQAAKFNSLPKEERIRILHEAIEKVNRDERPIDPKTGKPLMVQTKEFAINYLHQLMQEVSREPDGPPATVGPVAAPTAAEPAPVPPTDEERLIEIQNSLDAIERGEPAMHPTRGYLLRGSALEDYIGDLKEERTQIQSRINVASPAWETRPVPPDTAPAVPDIPEFGLPPDVTPQNLVTTIKSVLEANANVPRLNIMVPISVGKDYLVSTFKKGRVKKIENSGIIEKTGDNEITVTGLQLRVGLGPITQVITMDLVLRNGPDGLMIGEIGYYDGLGRDDAEESVDKLQATLIDKVDKDLEKDPRSPWTADKAKISGENVLITVHNIEPTDPTARRLNPT